MALVRHRTCSVPWSRLVRQNPINQGKAFGALTLRNVNLYPQLYSRSFSAAACSYYPRLPRGQRKRVEEDTMKRGKDVLTKAQDDLEMAAKAVTEADKAIIKKLGRDASFETYITLVLSRLRPFLIYFVHLGPEQFLKGYGPQASSLARGRTATMFLFISAHGWFFRAIAARSSISPDLPPELLQIAEKFTIAGQAVEAYVENKLPEGMGWPNVGGAVVDGSSDAWLFLSKTIARKDETTPSSKHDSSKADKGDGIT